MYRIRQLLKFKAIEIAAEEKMRSKLAADFHDELGNRITKISLFSEIIKNKFKTNQDEALEYLSKINDNANTLYNETRDFIWHLDPHKDTLFDLIARLKAFGDDLFEGTETEFTIDRIQNEFKTIKLSMDWRQHILRIFKEALHNALKYAESKKVELGIKKTGNLVFITLTDNGKGFELLKVKENNGLFNMKKRAEAITGKLEIFSKPDFGTEIKLIINLPE
jgi:signal transduction histidine kinase